MPLVEELNIEKVKKKVCLLWIATPLTRLAMTAYLEIVRQVIARNDSLNR